MAAIRVAAAPPVPPWQPHGTALHSRPRLPFRAPSPIHRAPHICGTEVGGPSPLCLGPTHTCGCPANHKQQNSVAFPKAAHASGTCDGSACREQLSGGHALCRPPQQNQISAAEGEHEHNDDSFKSSRKMSLKVLCRPGCPGLEGSVAAAGGLSSANVCALLNHLFTPGPK